MAPKRTKTRLGQRHDSKWKHFERLVAAIHQAADRGSEVRWNEVIDGRQFDATIRFRKGLYNHLTVVECKDLKQAVSVDKVEAFVTKSRDVHANVAVLASTNGFQSGAKDCAKRHGITLLHVTRGTTVDLASFGLRWGDDTEALHIESIALHYTDGTDKELPREANVLTYYTHHTMLERAGSKTTLDAFISTKLADLPLEEGYRIQKIAVEAGTKVIAPADGEIPLKELAAIEVRTALVKAKTIAGPHRVDPVILSPKVDVLNVGTNQTTSFDYVSLPLGIGNAFVTGKYYEAVGLGFFHYCRSVSKDTAEVWLVESFQHGHLVQGKLVLELSAAQHYIEVKDKAVIARLERRRKTME